LEKGTDMTTESKNGKKTLLAGGLLLALLLLLLRKRSQNQANLLLDSLIISPEQVYPGDKVVIQVNATNIGTNPGTGIVSFYDGVNLLERRAIELGPGGYTLVSIEIYPVTLGVHDITVNPGEFIGSFEVIIPPSPSQEPIIIGIYGSGKQMFQRYNFVSNTVPRRYFEFYTQGGNLYFISSRDTWWGPTVTQGLVVASIGYTEWTLHYNPVSNHVHLAWGNHYQRGTPDQFGQIEFDPVQTAGFTGVDSIACDSSNHPFVSRAGVVWKSKTADGTWVEHTEMGFPKTLYTIGGVNPTARSKIVQLMNDKMALVGCGGNQHYSSCWCSMTIYTYDGVGNWNIGGRNPVGVDSLRDVASFSAVGNGDSVLLIYLDSYVGHYANMDGGQCYRITNDYPGIHYAEYQYAPNSIVRRDLLSNLTPAPFTVISIDDYGERYVFWVDGSDIQLAFTRGGLWQDIIYAWKSDVNGATSYPHAPALQYSQDIHLYYTAGGLLKFYWLPNLLGV
jgi:hypothetical protein